MTVMAALVLGAVAIAQPPDPTLQDLSTAEATAVVDLVAAEQAVTAAQARSAALDAQADAARDDAREAKRRSAVARENARVARTALAERLEALYRRGGTDPVIVFLTAESLSRALDELSVLRRSVLRDEALARETAVGIRRAGAAKREADAEAAKLAAAAEAAEVERMALTSAQADAERTLAMIRADLANRRRALERVESAAQEVTETITSINESATPNATPPQAPASAPSALPEAIGAGRVLRVKAYAYTGGGLTASGLPTGTGRCAVDPAVIPLGTRFDVPGYGPCLAADTGYLIDGATIDVWLPTQADTVQWGIKYLDITIY